MSVYINLNTVTLYKTVKFNKIDSVMFSNKTERDNYFNSIPNTDKLEITDFTDLYEGRSIILPYNYLDLKDYNTMKLHYDDGLGHIEDYYCNVDNYLYISTDACYPIYRIDYFLTYSYMLYNKEIGIITDRRTVAENSLTKNMKADEIAVPRLQYKRHDTYYTLPGDNPKTPYYIVYLNKTKNNNGKLGINCKMQFYIGEDDLNNPYLYDIDTYTIGCYIAIADKDHLDIIIGTEPLEYIEKIVEVDTVINYLHTNDQSDLSVNGYVYLEHDIELGSVNDSHYFSKVNLYDNNKFLDDNAEFTSDMRVNLYPNHKKKILKWQPTTGIVIQGVEFDLKDFDDRDFPHVEGVTNYKYMYSTIYFFNFLGYTFAYPVGYRHEEVNMDFMVKWQSGRNFTYTSEYTNSLAYKELQEYNTQAVKYAKQQAGVQTYYNNKLLQATEQSLDISKQQTLLSWQNQRNSLNTQVGNLTTQHYSFRGGLSDLVSSLLNKVSFGVTGALKGGTNSLSYGVESDVNQNNIQLLRDQRNNLLSQLVLDTRAIENQRLQAQLNTQYQNDTIAIARDNTIANIAISNKYNNSKPNAYYETDFTQFSSYYYTYYIDLSEGNYIEQNIKNRYNVLGTYVGYMEKWKPSVYEGLYFDYIKGSIVNNSNDVSGDIPDDIYIELTLRIEEGIRIWHPSQLAWFGNLIIDNTNLGTAEPYNAYTEEQKTELNTSLEELMYDNLLDKGDCKTSLYSTYPTIATSYIDWLVDNQPWGTTNIPAERQTEIYTYQYILRFDYSVEETQDLIKIADFFTVYEKQWVLPQIV